jgi:cell wall-associated NlpC family hydrolase
MTTHQKRVVRSLIKQGAHQLMASPGSVHYTQGSLRWSAINQHKHIGGRVLPFYGDCSSTVTWLYWASILKVMGRTGADILNGARWTAGYTGTLAQHGKRVSGVPGTRRVGDLVLYGRAPTFEHVAILVAPDTVFSHGSEAGPFLLPVHYRPDVGQFRRYI